MNITVAITGGLEDFFKEEVKRAEDAIVGGLRDASKIVQERLAEATRSALHGNRLPRTWRAKVYPNQGKNAAALVYSKAPKLLGVYSRGAVIQSAGGKMLAVPTPACPRRGRDGKAITPKNFPGKLRWVPRGGKLRYSLLVLDDARLTKRGRGVKASLSSIKHGRTATIPMFVLLPQVRVKKRIDLDRMARLAGDTVLAAIVRNWESPSGQ